MEYSGKALAVAEAHQDKAQITPTAVNPMQAVAATAELLTSITKDQLAPKENSQSGSLPNLQVVAEVTLVMLKRDL